ncbi:MAG: C1 family peptidase [Litorimonas sp.]
MTIKSFKTLSEQLDLSVEQIAYARLAGVTTGLGFATYLGMNPDPALFDATLIADVEGLYPLEVSKRRQEKKTPSRRVRAYGARQPQELQTRVPAIVPQPNKKMVERFGRFVRGPLAGELAFDGRPGIPWPTREQGERGTCVAFSVTAALELARYRDNGQAPDLSEQYLYWAVKHHGLDPWPDESGTGHEHVAKAASQHGVCREHHWTYNPNTIVGSVSQDPPPNGAVVAAQQSGTAQLTVQIHQANSGHARTVLDLLRAHGGVAIAMPVYARRKHGLSNWNVPGFERYGKILNPPPGWVHDGDHAVFVTGFVPDPDEPTGGHFIIRNTWGPDWAWDLPHKDALAPQTGYGQISATYIDLYLWETCVA